MTEQENLYVQSQERWQKEQALLIEMLEENLRNSKKMISIHMRTAKITRESIEFEKHNLKRNKEIFEKWKDENK